MIEFPDNAINVLGSRPFTSDNEIGSTEVDFKVHLKGFVTSHQGQSHQESDSLQGPDDQAQQELYTSSVLYGSALPSAAALSGESEPKTRFAIYAQRGLQQQLIHEVLLQLVEDATAEGRLSDECVQTIVGGLRRSTRDVFRPKRADPSHCEPMPAHSL
jgi:hypothetical protein